LKREIIALFNCPTQMIRKRTLNEKTKGVLSCASKIVLQMNAKLGFPLWTIPNSHEFWKNKKIAISGIASSRGKGGTTLAFVGTINNNLTNIFCE